jgi:hypothetical protein
VVVNDVIGGIPESARVPMVFANSTLSPVVEVAGPGVKNTFASGSV